MIRALARRAPDATTTRRSRPSSRAGSAVFLAATRPSRRWKRSACPARRLSPCTRPWPLRLCASAAPCARDATIGEFDVPGLPVKFSRWVDRSEVAADRLGEHNEGVLRELLSLTDKEIASLYADKVIVRDPLLDTSGGRQ